MAQKKEMATTYNPKEFEDRLYDLWQEKGYFTPKADKNKKIVYNSNTTSKYYRKIAPWTRAR